MDRAACRHASKLPHPFANLVATRDTAWHRRWKRKFPKKGDAHFVEEQKISRRRVTKRPRVTGAPDHTPALVGPVFNDNYNALPLRDLVERIRIAMPQDRPGSLTRRAAVDVVAYLVFEGAFPLGRAELSDSGGAGEDPVSRSKPRSSDHMKGMGPGGESLHPTTTPLSLIAVGNTDWPAMSSPSGEATAERAFSAWTNAGPGRVQQVSRAIVVRIDAPTVAKRETLSGRRGPVKLGGGRTNNESAILPIVVAVRTCSVSFADHRGIRHSVDVDAESLFEAAILAIQTFRQDPWLERIGPATVLDVEVRQPGTTHAVSLQQVERWLAAATTNPTEASKKAKLKMMLVQG